jgi:hypothetical protein
MNKETGLTAQRLMFVVWPAFLVAGAAELVFFSIFDPFELHFFGAPLDLSREWIYTMGFFGFWAMGIASSALTLFLERGPLGMAPDADDDSRNVQSAERERERG